MGYGRSYFKGVAAIAECALHTEERAQLMRALPKYFTRSVSAGPKPSGELRIGILRQNQRKYESTRMRPNCPGMTLPRQRGNEPAAVSWINSHRN